MGQFNLPRPLSHDQIIAMMGGGLGRQALEEGWHGTLYGFIAKHRRTPASQAEISQCRIAANGTDETIFQMKAAQTLIPIKAGIRDLATFASDIVQSKRIKIEIDLRELLGA